MQVAGGDLKGAYDPNDSVGILDGYFPDAHFFTQVEQFDRHFDELRHRGDKVDYASVCSPNRLQAVLLALRDEVFPFGGLLVCGIHGKGA
jgi:hypothetical protein